MSIKSLFLFFFALSNQLALGSFKELFTSNLMAGNAPLAIFLTTRLQSGFHYSKIQSVRPCVKQIEKMSDQEIVIWINKDSFHRKKGFFTYDTNNALSLWDQWAEWYMGHPILCYSEIEASQDQNKAEENISMRDSVNKLIASQKSIIQNLN